MQIILRSSSSVHFLNVASQTVRIGNPKGLERRQRPLKPGDAIIPNH
jgi:hypothetical protein